MATPFITLSNKDPFGKLTNASSVLLADQTNTFGIIRLDNQQVVVAAGTAVTNPYGGVYQYDISGLDPRFTYIASWGVTNTYGTQFITELINPQGQIVTRGQIRAAAARAMGLLIREGTTTAATALTVTDASTLTGGTVSDSDSSSDFDGGFLLLTSGPAAGNWREISTGKYNPLTGTVTVAAAFTTGQAPATGGGDNYEIYTALTPDQWSLRDNNSIVDYGLRRCRFRHRHPLTLCPDGSMDMDGTASWTPTNSALAKTAIDSVTTGANALLVMNVAGNGYAESSVLAVTPNHAYKIWVDYRCVGTSLSTAYMQVWDKTNNKQLGSNATDADNGINFEGGMMQLDVTTASNTYNIVVRLCAKESNAVVVWDDVIVMSSGRTRYISDQLGDSDISNRNQIMAYQTREGSRPFEYKFNNIGWPQDIQEDASSLSVFIIDIPRGAADKPLYIDHVDAYGPMHGISDNIPSSCPLEWATFSVAREAWQMYSRALEGATMSRAIMDRAAIEYLAWQKDLMFMPVYEASIGLPQGMSGVEISSRML